MQMGIKCRNKRRKTMSIIACIIGMCAVALLVYYIYVLMKGDK